MPTCCRQRCSSFGVLAEVTLLDRSAAHLPDPRAWPSALPTPRAVAGDALALPLPDASVDIVSCCLFLHHLEPPQITRYLAEAQRVARIAIVINDLERSALHYRLAQMNRVIDHSRISRHDGPASVRRAYTYSELARMLANTGCSFLLERAYLYRLGASYGVATRNSQGISGQRLSSSRPELGRGAAPVERSGFARTSSSPRTPKVEVGASAVQPMPPLSEPETPSPQCRWASFPAEAR